MSASTHDVSPAAGGTAPATTVSLGWALRRTALAIAILVVSVGSVAWLTHASIKASPDDEVQTAGGSAVGEQ